MNKLLKYTLLLCLFIITFVSSKLFSQPVITFDSTTYNVGTIYSNIYVFKLTIGFTNTGNENLIITQANTTDGASIIDWDNIPVAPGERGFLTYERSTGNVGKFSKAISIRTNADSKTLHKIFITGVIIWPETKVHVDNDFKEIGKVPFGEIDTVIFEITNAGNQILHLSFDQYTYPETDLLFCLIRPKKNSEEFDDYYSLSLEINEIAMVFFIIKNNYGNTGKFERNFCIRYNNSDTLGLTIKGEYTGSVPNEVIYQEQSVYYYEDNKLIKKAEYYPSGNLRNINYYQGSYCIHKKAYSWRKELLSKEFIYSEGKLINMIDHKVNDY